MKKQKLKNFLKIGILSFGIFLLLWNCQTENFSDSESNSERTSEPDTTVSSRPQATYKIVTKKEVPEIAALFNTAFNNSRFKKAQVSPIIYELTKPSGVKSYSAIIGLEHNVKNKFYNIAVEQSPNGILGEAIVVEYQTSISNLEITTENYNTFNWKIRQQTVESFLIQQNSQYLKSSTQPCPETETSFDIGAGGLGFSVTGSGGSNLSNNFINNSGGTNTGSRLTFTTGWVTVCSPMLTTRKYSCNGPNSGTPHSPGPNSGNSGDTSCGDASTGYGGSGSTVVPIQSCRDFYVVVENYVVRIDDWMISLDDSRGDGVNELIQLEENLASGILDLNDNGKQLATEITKKVSSLSLGQKSTSGKGFTNKTKDSPCPEPIDLPIAIPNNSWELYGILNTLTLSYIPNLTDAEINWIFDIVNSAEVDELLSFLDENDESDGAKEFAENHIEALRIDDYSQFFEQKLFTQDPYGVWKNELNSQEKEIIKTNPYKAYKIFKNRAVAVTETENRFGTNGLNDKSDAFRHAFFQAINSRDVGVSFAGDLADAHESETPLRWNLEKLMDLKNNEFGLLKGSENPSANNQTISSLINQAVLDGDLVYLSPINNADPNFWDNLTTPEPNDGTHGITPLTAIIPTNQ
tara:strand:+ start:204 stop:2111 length:1908 start_codon:yes stop_codon:yes gene_type:complete